MRTVDLWCRKQPLYQLRHNHCPQNTMLQLSATGGKYNKKQIRQVNLPIFWHSFSLIHVFLQHLRKNWEKIIEFVCRCLKLVQFSLWINGIRACERVCAWWREGEHVWEWEWACVCVCGREREREREQHLGHEFLVCRESKKLIGGPIKTKAKLIYLHWHTKKNPRWSGR